jgi:hypothetical protein
MNVKLLKIFMVVTDIGFILYWLITIAHLIPPESLFRDYTNPIMIQWNWSFLPLDLMVSATGITSLVLFKRNKSEWIQLALVSLTLTSASGLQALAFWAIAGDFDISWWLPNLFLLLYPLFFIRQLIENRRYIDI